MTTSAKYRTPQSRVSHNILSLTTALSCNSETLSDCVSIHTFTDLLVHTHVGDEFGRKKTINVDCQRRVRHKDAVRGGETR